MIKVFRTKNAILAEITYCNRKFTKKQITEILYERKFCRTITKTKF